jgi:hypothetical protein
MAVSRKSRQRRVPKNALHMAIFAALADGATATRDELLAAVPQIHQSTAYRLFREMLRAGVIYARRTAPGATHPLRFALTLEALHAAGTPKRTSKVSRGRPAGADTWTPAPWVNPIRARALGLPVAQAPREVPATDFGNPRRVAA